MLPFGGQPQQQQSGGFFGQAQPSPSPFGVAPPLPGAQQPASGGGLFGSSATPTSTSLFGAQPAQQAAGGLFGQQQPAASAFGQPAATGGLFGQPQQQPATGMGLFGSTAQPTPSPTPSAFGGMGTMGGGFGAAAMGGAGGTSVQKYQTTRDQELNMRLLSITAMDCYKNKSFEELRWEDVQANRGQPGGAAGAAPAFGAQPSQPASGGLFGASTTTSPAPGGVFGQPAAQPSTGLFGSTTPATSGLFGSTATQPSTGGLFGSAITQPTPASGGLFCQSQPQASAFGQPSTTGGLFGSSQPSTGGGLFGSTGATAQPTTGGLFGSTTATSQPATGGLFGSTQPASSGGLFGQASTSPSTGGLFASTQPTSTPTTGGLFGSTPAAQPATGGLFGSSTTTQPTTGGGLFGSSTTTTQPSTGGLFGASTTATTTPSTGGLFGSSTTTAQPSSGGLFGTSMSQPATGGLFGTSTPATGGGLFGSTTTQPAAGGGLFGTTSTSTQPATGGGLFGPSTGTTPASGGWFGSSTPGGGLFGTSTSSTQPSAGGGLFGTNTTGGLFGSATCTAIQPAAGTGLGFAQGGLFGAPATPAAAPAAVLPPVPRPTGLVTPKPVDKDSLSAFLWKDKASETPLVPRKKISAPASPPSPRTFVPQPSTAPALGDVTGVGFEATGETPLRIRAQEPTSVTPSGSPKIVKPKITFTTPTKTGQTSPTQKVLKSVLPICANHNLWLKPSLEAMEGMTEQELARVEHFQIGQYGVGSVTWPGLTDVRFLNIDDIIVFKKGSVTLFPDEDLKPPVGTGLNKTAIIELFVKPKNVDLAKKYQARYVEEMRKLTESNGAEFLSYDLEAWRFRVEHFSTWGILDSEWTKIDALSGRGNENLLPKNDLSLFSRLEQDLFEHEEMEEESVGDLTMEREEKVRIDTPKLYAKEDFVGALAVAPPTREELKAMGWNLKLMDLFLNQSFRVSFSADGKMVSPEHPVVCEAYNMVVAPTRADEKFNQEPIIELVKHMGEEWENLVEILCQHKSVVSVMSLIKALLSESSDEGSINTAAFNEWLSKGNAARIQADPSLAFSPSAALSSKHYSPSASELLISMGQPRLAMAAAAAMDDTSRRLMQEQLGLVQDSNIETQKIAAILGGNIEALEGLDWRTELALRYWYCEGDLTDFDPPANSIEWRIVRAVVLGDSLELFKLLDENIILDELGRVFMAMVVVRMRKPEMIAEEHFLRVTVELSDRILASKNVDWQLSPIVLSFLTKSSKRDQMIEDVVARNIEEDYGLLVKFKIVSERSLTAARAMDELAHGNADVARVLATKEGLNELIDAAP